MVLLRKHISEDSIEIYVSTTLIPKAQNALAIIDDTDLNAPLRPVLEHLKDLAPENETRTHTNLNCDAFVLEADVQPLRPPVNDAVLLAGLADYGRVDDGKQLLDVVVDQLVEEVLVALLQVHHGDVALQRLLALTQVVHELLLLQLFRHVEAEPMWRWLMEKITGQNPS
ncbi:hypothetical protein EJB05_39782, partial [Eragrostis curvula]